MQKRVSLCGVIAATPPITRFDDWTQLHERATNFGTNVPTLVGREDKAKATELMPQTTTIRWRLTLAAHMVARVGNIVRSGIATIRKAGREPLR